MPSLRSGLVTMASLLVVVYAGCGKDSYFNESAGPAATVELGEGIEVITPADTLLRFFDDFTASTFQDRPAIPLQDLIGVDAVESPVLHAFRLIGTDGFYANMPGKGYGDNTWTQLSVGYLDLIDFGVVFQTELDPMLRKGHNVKWLIRVEVLRAIDVLWTDGRKPAPVRDIATVTLPDGYTASGDPGMTLASVVEHVCPSDLVLPDYLFRVRGAGGSSLPRLLTWEEMNRAYFVPELDRVLMPEELGSAYELADPQSIRLEVQDS